MLDLVLRALRRSRNPQTDARISKQRISGNVYLKSSRWPDYFPTDARARQRWVLMEGGRLLVGRRQEESVTQEEFSVERDFIYIEEQGAFFAAVAGERVPESPAVDALVSMQIIEAAMAAWKEQQRVAIF